MRPVETYVLVNGRREGLLLPRTIGQFLEDAGWKETQVVVELNGRVLPRHQLAKTCLSEGDRLEIVVPVAGG